MVRGLLSDSEGSSALIANEDFMMMSRGWWGEMTG